MEHLLVVTTIRHHHSLHDSHAGLDRSPLDAFFDLPPPPFPLLLFPCGPKYRFEKGEGDGHGKQKGTPIFFLNAHITRWKPARIVCEGTDIVRSQTGLQTGLLATIRTMLCSCMRLRMNALIHDDGCWPRQSASRRHSKCGIHLASFNLGSCFHPVAVMSSLSTISSHVM